MRHFIKHIACYLAFVMFLIGIAPKVDAGLSPSEVVAIAQFDRAADLEKIQKVLETKMIGERLRDLGFTENEIQERLSMLNDAQIQGDVVNLRVVEHTILDFVFSKPQIPQSLSDHFCFEDLEKIQKVLETKMIGERLRDLGFTENEIQERLSMLNDAQIHNIALDLDQLKVGGNGFGLVIVLLVIAILVVLLIQLTGHKVVVH